MKKIIAVLVVGLMFSAGCSGEKKDLEQKGKNSAGLTKEKLPVTSEVGKAAKLEEPLVTFVELGSVNCVPCKMMQPVMKEIEETYKSKVKVVFYDVWTPAGRPFGEKYGINLIPTQVFLDKAGKEFFRHEGYFPKEDIEALLKKQGIDK